MTPAGAPSPSGAAASPSRTPTPTPICAPAASPTATIRPSASTPRLYRRDGNRLSRLPALVAAVIDNTGTLTGIHRTWLDAREPRKAPLDEPRKALGRLRGNAVRFNRPAAGGALVAGEGIETVLSVVTALPGIAAAATLSAANLAAFELPPDLGLLIVASDTKQIERLAAERLARRCRETLCPAHVVLPVQGDFNDDLRNLGPGPIGVAIAPLIATFTSGLQHAS